MGQEDRALLEFAATSPVFVTARRDFPSAPGGGADPLVIMDGWAFRSELLSDGRRQITDFLLPGEVIVPNSDIANAALNVTAVTSVTYLRLPADRLAECHGLRAALRASHLLEERLLRRQIVRLGRFDASERVVDWLLEIYDRLDAAGLCSGDSMPLPVTQEVMADTLGLTGVHINRTLANLRREGLLNIRGGRITFLDRERCRSMVGAR